MVVVIRSLFTVDLMVGEILTYYAEERSLEFLDRYMEK